MPWAHPPKAHSLSQAVLEVLLRAWSPQQEPPFLHADIRRHTHTHTKTHTHTHVCMLIFCMSVYAHAHTRTHRAAPSAPGGAAKAVAMAWLGALNREYILPMTIITTTTTTAATTTTTATTRLMCVWVRHFTPHKNIKACRRNGWTCIKPCKHPHKLHGPPWNRNRVPRSREVVAPIGANGPRQTCFLP